MYVEGKDDGFSKSYKEALSFPVHIHRFPFHILISILNIKANIPYKPKN